MAVPPSAPEPCPAVQVAAEELADEGVPLVI
jgi:hypothetical protein